MLRHCSNELYEGVLSLLGVEDRDEIELLLMVQQRCELFEHFVVSKMNQFFILVEILD